MEKFVVVDGTKLIYSHKNELLDNEIHYLFTDGKFFYWVEVINDKIIKISPTNLTEAKTWENFIFTELEYENHLSICEKANEDINIWYFQLVLLNI